MTDVAELLRLLAAVPRHLRADALSGIDAAVEAYQVNGDEELLERSATTLVAALRVLAEKSQND